MSSRGGVVVLAALIPLAVLGLDPAGWYWFGPLKWFAVSTLVPAGAAIVLLRRPARLVTRPFVAGVALVAIMAIAAVLALDARYAWLGTPERHFGAVTWLWCLVALVAGMALTTDGDRAVVAIGLVVAGSGLGLASTAEALGWEPEVFDVGDRLSATLGSPAYLGAAVALLLPGCVGCAIDGRLPRWARGAAAAAVLPLGVAAVGSGARAAWVGLVAAAFVTVVARREQLTRHRRATAFASGAIVLALLLAAFATPAGPRFSATFDDNEPGGRGRLDEWRVAARVIADHPVVGVGPESYRLAFAAGVDASYEREHGRDPLPDRAHAAPLDVAISGGVVALAAWAAFVAFAAVHVWRALRSGSAMLAGVSAGLVAHGFGSLLLFPLAELEPITWLLAGMVMTATARRHETREVVVARPIVAGVNSA